MEYARGGLGRVQAIALEDYRKDMREVLFDLYSRTAEVIIGMVRDSGKAFGLKVFETKGEAELDVVLERMLEWFGVHAMEQAVLVSGTMADEVALAVEAGIAEGMAEAEIGRMIRQRVEGLSRFKPIGLPEQRR